MSARLTDHDRYLRSITEATVQAQVERLATLHGWLWWHAPDNRPITTTRGHRYVQDVRAGFPDLILTRGTRGIALELKRQTGRVKPEQVTWLLALQAAGFEVAVVRPSDLERLVVHLGWLAWPLPVYQPPTTTTDQPATTQETP